MGLELDDIQGLVARGYANLAAATYVLARIDDVASARGWLASVASQVTPANAKPTNVALNVAFTASGLQKLGLLTDPGSGLSNEFTTGMTTPHRRRILGDLDANAPEGWLWGGPGTPAVDLLLMLFAPDVARLGEAYAALAAGFAGVAMVQQLDATIDLDGLEHFGFADGIAQPTVEGLSARVDRPANTVKAGEFILGYSNEYGRYTDRPLLPAASDPRHLLPADVGGSGRADFGRNGSYLVFRHLSQDVHGFWRWVDQATSGAGGSDPRRRAQLAAKMVGRWPSGAPVLLAPDQDDPRHAGANDFDYQHVDPNGLRCPIGAHVRRANPRDSLDPEPGTDRSIAVNKRHRLLRRGREYGPPVDDPFGTPSPGDPDRGLYFVCLCGNIARQFEFVQHTWLNNPKFDALYDDADPLVASHAGGATFTAPAEPVRQRYTGLPRFVTVRGGGYFFLPGLRALRYLASLP